MPGREHTPHPLTDVLIIEDSDRLIPLDYTYDPEEIFARVAALDYPGYPFQADRLRMTPEEIVAWEAAGRPYKALQLKPDEDHPQGRNAVYVHTHRLGGLASGKAIIDDGERDLHDTKFETTYTEKPIEHDSRGAPLHPYHQILLQHGAIIGPGWYYNEGPERTVDAVILRNIDGILHLLSIIRGDVKQIALPGGMLEGITPEAATLKELLEETSVESLPEGTMHHVADEVVADPRQTIHVWPETSIFYTFLTDELAAQIKPVGGDDADDAFWHPVNQETIDTYFGSHSHNLRLALLKWEAETGMTVDKNGRIGKAKKPNKQT